jgi:arylsulfatase A-like enzyme
LKKLGDEGVTLTNYYVHEVCSPSRGAFLSGRFAYRLGYQGVISSSEETGVPLNISMIPEFLHKANYKCHALGKWHVGLYLNEMLPTNRGFDSYFGA